MSRSKALRLKHNYIAGKVSKRYMGDAHLKHIKKRIEKYQTNLYIDHMLGRSALTWIQGLIRIHLPEPTHYSLNHDSCTGILKGKLTTIVIKKKSHFFSLNQPWVLEQGVQVPFVRIIPQYLSLIKQFQKISRYLLYRS